MTYYFYSENQNRTSIETSLNNDKKHIYCYVMADGEWKLFTEQRKDNLQPYGKWSDCELIASGDDLPHKYLLERLTPSSQSK